MATDSYVLSDTFHRAVALTDSSGAITEAYDTDAYGNTQIYDAPGGGGDWFADDAQGTDEPRNQFIYTGRRYDSESDIYFYRARYYVPKLGRFVSRDPIGYVAGPALYEYVSSKPSRMMDPSGLVNVKPWEKDLFNDLMFDLMEHDRKTKGWKERGDIKTDCHCDRTFIHIQLSPKDERKRVQKGGVCWPPGKIIREKHDGNCMQRFVGNAARQEKLCPCLKKKCAAYAYFKCEFGLGALSAKYVWVGTLETECPVDLERKKKIKELEGNQEEEPPPPPIIVPPIDPNDLLDLVPRK